jgi:hypothetical protein
MRLILHIGTEKTATTTIQNFLYRNREILLNKGIALSDFLEKPNNRKLPSFCMPEGSFDAYFTNRGITTIQQKKQYFSSFVDDFRKEVKSLASSTDTMFISSEHLHSRLQDTDSIGFLKNLLDGLFSRVSIVCYFREQSAVVKSLYSTMIKVSYSKGFDSLLQDCEPSNPYYNYYDSFMKWSDVFGKNNIVPRIFSREQFLEGDIRKDILNIIDKDYSSGDYNYSVDGENKSLGFIGLELGRVNNLVNSRYREDGSVNTIRNRMQRIINDSEISQKGRLPFPSAAQIYQKFAESNLAFAREFLGINSNPFTHPETAETEPSNDAEYINDPLLQDFLGFFEKLLLDMRRLPDIDNTHADSLRDLALKVEKKEPLNLVDAKYLMELAHIIRPSGPFIKRKLKEYEQRLKKNS